MNPCDKTRCCAINKRVLDNERLSVLCTELAEILKSGITVGEGFLIISEEESDAGLKTLYESLYRETLSGCAVGGAMRNAGVFPEHFLRSVGLAEQTGALESVLRELAAYYDRQERLRRTVRSSVGYPLLLFFIVLAVFFVFLTEVLPVFDRVFAQIGASMLPAAEVFLAFGLWLAGAKWWLLGAVLLIAAAAAAVRLVPAWNKSFSAAVSRLFSGTKTGKKIAAARVASAMSLAVAGASDINEALALSCEFASGSVSEAGLRDCLDLVLAGRSISEAAGEAGLFSPVYCRMLTVGERTGSLETIMRDIARRTEQDMTAAVDRLTGRIEPVAVVILSVCVGLLLLSVMLPLVGIMSVL